VTDQNGNGIGIDFLPGFFSDEVTFPWGACGQALALIDPSYVLPAGGTNVYGRTLARVAQDLADLVVAEQFGADNFGAGSWNLGAAETFWATLALSNYEKLGAVISPDARTALSAWLTSSRDASTSLPLCGGWDVSLGSSAGITATATGIFEDSFVGAPVPSSALGFLYRNWNSTGLLNCYWTDDGDEASSGLYALALALRAASTVQLNDSDCGGTPISSGFDWYQAPVSAARAGIQSTLIASQGLNGQWFDEGDCPLPIAQTTAWSAATLMPVPLAPQAIICNCNVPAVDVNEPITFDASCSYALDTSRAIVSYDWDFNYDGSSFIQSQDQNDEPVSGVLVTKADGFSQYTASPSNPGAAVYQVALRVTDNRSAQSIAVCNVAVAPPPHCPIANSGGGASHTYHGFIGAPIQFDATGSFDEDGNPLTYAWDLQNLNRFGDSMLAQPTLIYNTPGMFAVELQVTDHPANNEPSCTETAFATVIVE
jgi:hypothetical protein